MAVDSSEVTNYLKYLDELNESIKYLQASKEDRKDKKKPLKGLTRVHLFYDRDADFINLSDLVPIQIQNNNLSSTSFSQILFNIQVDYSSDLRDVFAQEETIKENNRKFNTYLVEHFDWYIRWSSELHCDTDCLSFITTNKDFKNQIAVYSYEKTIIYKSRIKNFEDKLHLNMSKLRYALKNK